MWEGKVALVVLLGVCASLSHCDDAVGNVHTIVVTDCSKYFVFQTMGVVYSHWKSRQPGPITRVMCCTEKDAKSVTQEELDLVKTHIAPDFTIHPETGDNYGAYNKPGAVMDFLNNNKIEEEYILVLDGDMLLRRPVIPQEMGARLGLGISARYGYLKGVSNDLALKHIPYVAPRHDTDGGGYGRRADQVGGFFLTHRDDMRRVAPLWFNFTSDVRQDPDAWNLTGDIYSTTRGSKPWISEMYGYAFGAATAGLWHKIDDDAMIYPEYVQDAVPKIIHYGLLYKIPGTNFSFDKHWHLEFDPFVCPPWKISGKKTEGGLLPHPPHPQELKKNESGWRRYSQLISIETVNTLNEAHCQRHLRNCPMSPQLIEECGKVHDIATELEKEFMILDKALCRDEETSADCQKWKESGECQKNVDFMKKSCTKTCGACSHSKPRRIFEMTVSGDSIKATGNTQEQLRLHGPEVDRGKKAHSQGKTRNDVKKDVLEARKTEMKAIRELKHKCGDQRKVLTALEMEKCMAAAKAGLQYEKSGTPSQIPNQVSKEKKSHGEWVRGTKVEIGSSEKIHERTLEGVISTRSLWIVQLWMWGLVIFGSLSLLRARTRANARYIRREEALVGFV
ncbi:hypothetical protein BSKO_06603 [Bryopsis sp. KO-2023]|nr:hypothetical protein BSKO_06603 [Bryopsis sp. KO-2023]